jgi:hypothetical protein
MTTVIDRLQALHLLALTAALRGPSLLPPTPEEREQIRAAEVVIRETGRNLNGYRPPEWDAAHP